MEYYQPSSNFTARWSAVPWQELPTTTYYYIETRHPETLWDFADALREYGFADAIYITGGKCHSFYRTPDGKPHNIGDDTQHPHKKYQEIVPWIIFKAR